MLPAAPLRWPTSTELPTVTLELPRIWPMVNGGGSHFVCTTPLLSFSLGMSSAMTGPGRGGGATVDGFAEPITSPAASITCSLGAGMSSPTGATCSSNVDDGPGESVGKL